MKNAYIWGIGENTKKILEFINEDINICGFIISGQMTELQKKMWEKRNVIENGKIEGLEFDYIIIGSTDYEDEIKAVLIEKLLSEGESTEKIVLGRLDNENIIGNSKIYNVNKWCAVSTVKTVEAIQSIRRRNIFWDMVGGG